VIALYTDFPLAFTPTTEFKTSNLIFPRSYSSLFFTPGLKLRLVPGLKYSPYFVVGVGVARLSPSDTRLDGLPNREHRPKTKGTVSVGGGIDVRLFRYVYLRGEVRDYYTGTPQFAINLFKDRQHSLLPSAGIALRF
jgi:hypothetical protein